MPSIQSPGLKTAAVTAVIIGCIAIAAASFSGRKSGPSANSEKPGMPGDISGAAEKMDKKPSADNLNSQAEIGAAQTGSPGGGTAKDKKSVTKLDAIEHPPEVKLITSVSKTESTAKIAEVNLLDEKRYEGENTIANHRRQPVYQRAPKEVNPIFDQKPVVLSEQTYLVFFKPDSTELDGQALAEINKLVELVSQHPDSNILIEGYSDSFGNNQFNRKLSRYRAEIVKSFLLARGVGDSRITAVGLGSKSPIGDNKTPAGRKKNRRVEIKVKL
jgi:outer membrane protein OmpA-like peptidoglycan-associated protein